MTYQSVVTCTTNTMDGSFTIVYSYATFYIFRVMGKHKKSKKQKKSRDKEAKLDKKLALWMATFKEKMVSL